MTIFAIERNGSLVNHVVFKGNNQTSLYRERDVVPLTFTTLKSATEIAYVLGGTVIDYTDTTSTQLDKAA